MTAPDPYAKPPNSCGLGYCRATRRPRSKYCSVEHGKIARDEQDATAQARRDINAHLERVARGQAAPTPHIGVFTSTNGIVLSGDVVREVRFMMARYRAAQADLGRLLRNGGTVQSLLQRHEQAVRESEQAFLAHLDRLLPATTINPPPPT